MSNILRTVCNFPETLTKRGVSKIVLCGTTAEGCTIMGIVNDKAFRFYIEKRNTNKRWIKTLENYEVASKGLGIEDDNGWLGN